MTYLIRGIDRTGPARPGIRRPLPAYILALTIALIGCSRTDGGSGAHAPQRRRVASSFVTGSSGLIAGFPSILDTTRFISYIKARYKLEVDSPRFDGFRERITFYRNVLLNGARDSIVLVEYDYGDGCNAAFPWKYQLLLRPDGRPISVLGEYSWSLVTIFPQEPPFFVAIERTPHGNGGYVIYRIHGDSLEGVLNGLKVEEGGAHIQTFDDCLDQDINDPPALIMSVHDENHDGNADVIFTGKYIYSSVGEVDDGESDTIPVRYVFLYNRMARRFVARENYSRSIGRLLR